MSQKNYVGNGWEHPKFEGCVNVSLNLEKLKELEVNDYGDIKLTVAKMREPSAKTKATHTVYVNDYNPAVTGGGTNFKKDPASDDGMPF